MVGVKRALFKFAIRMDDCVDDDYGGTVEMEVGKWTFACFYTSPFVVIIISFSLPDRGFFTSRNNDNSALVNWENADYKSCFSNNTDPATVCIFLVRGTRKTRGKFCASN